MMRSTHARPVSGSVHCSTILAEPSFATCSMTTMHALGAVDEVHRAAHALDHLAGHGPVGDVAARRDLHRAEHGGRDAAAADHAEARGRVEVARRPGSTVTVSLPALMSFGSSSPSHGYGPTPRMPFSECSTTWTPVGQVVRDERRQADAEVHVGAVLELAGGAGGHLVAGERHQAVLRSVGRGRTVTFSIGRSAACSGVSSDDAVDVDAGQVDVVGVRARPARRARRPRRS